MSIDGMISIRINGEHRRMREGLSLAALASELGFVPEKIAVERNLEVVPRSTLAQVIVEDGDELEIVHFVGGGDHAPPPVGRHLDRCWADLPLAPDRRNGQVQEIRAKRRCRGGIGRGNRHRRGAARQHVSDRGAPMLTDYHRSEKDHLPAQHRRLLHPPKTRSARLRLAREAGGWDLVKLEVLGEARTLYPDMRETLKRLRSSGQAKASCRWSIASMIRLPRSSWKSAGAVAVMPLGAPIGSGLGIQNRVTIRLIVEGARGSRCWSMPGSARPADAAEAMELGCDGVLMNTAIAEAKDPVLHGPRDEAWRSRADAMAYLAGRMAKRKYADPSSPLAGLI
jgi:thiazole synthase